MSDAGLVFAVVMGLISLLSVGYPLLSRQITLGESARQRRLYDELMTTYERVVATIRDLDEDFRTGKLNESDYRPEREQWVARGITTLQQIEEIGPLPSHIAVPTPAEATTTEDDTDTQIEEAIARYMNTMKEPASAG